MTAKTEGKRSEPFILPESAVQASAAPSKTPPVHTESSIESASDSSSGCLACLKHFFDSFVTCIASSLSALYNLIFGAKAEEKKEEKPAAPAQTPPSPSGPKQRAPLPRPAKTEPPSSSAPSATEETPEPEPAKPEWNRVHVDKLQNLFIAAQNNALERVEIYRKDKTSEWKPMQIRTYLRAEMDKVDDTATSEEWRQYVAGPYSKVTQAAVTMDREARQSSSAPTITLDDFKNIIAKMQSPYQFFEIEQ